MQAKHILWGSTPPLLQTTTDMSEQALCWFRSFHGPSAGSPERSWPYIKPVQVILVLSTESLLYFGLQSKQILSSNKNYYHLQHYTMSNIVDETGELNVLTNQSLMWICWLMASQSLSLPQKHYILWRATCISLQQLCQSSRVNIQSLIFTFLKTSLNSRNLPEWRLCLTHLAKQKSKPIRHSLSYGLSMVKSLVLLSVSEASIW